MLNEIFQMFSYEFITRAIIVGILVSLCAALLGVSLVLKKYSMIGDGLSHVGFGALAIAMVLNMAPLQLAIPVTIVVAFFLLRISESSKIKGDAAIGLISASALAIGVMAISLSKGINTDICNYLFGSILAMSKSDVQLSIICATLVLGLFIIFYNKIFAITFDEEFAKATGTKTNIYNMLLAILTAITIVLGMRLMGSLLISSLILFPPLTAMRLFKRFKTVTIASSVISLVCFLIGIIISYLYSTPVGASIVIINIIVFLIFTLIGSIKGKTSK